MQRCRIAATVYVATQIHATVKAADASAAVSRIIDLNESRDTPQSRLSR